jgi:malonyl-CoA/methylmalonyl-CoA synthetase
VGRISPLEQYAFPVNPPDSMQGLSVSPETISAWARHIGTDSIDPVDVRARLGSGTLSAEFSRSARRMPHSPALTIGSMTMTHGEIDDAAALAASRLRALSSRPGEAVLLVMNSAMATVIAYLGILRTGAAVAPVHPSLTAREVKRIAVDSGARLLVGSGTGLRAVISDPPEGISEVVGLEPEDREHAGVVISDISSEPMEEFWLDGDSPAVLAFTSGTTGRPKCAPLSHRNLLASIRGVMWAWRWKRGDHLLHSLPISHQHGLGGIHATLLSGSRATILPTFDSEGFLATLRAGGPTILFGVPAIHQRLLDELGDRAHTLNRLRLVTSGSAPLPIETALRFTDVTGLQILERYGTTESGLDVSNPYRGKRIPGTVGLPLPGVEVAVVDENNERVPHGESGEILIRGPQVFSGYRGSRADSFRKGWFASGDDGFVHPQSGYLSIVGRRKELIISGGMNVYPLEVEDAIRSLDEVSDVAVIGIPSKKWGEEVVAFVTPETVNEARVLDRISGLLAAYKRPKRIIPVPDIPRSSVGKIDRQRLEQMAG